MATGEISVLNLPLKTSADISNGDYFLFIDDGILSKILKTDLYTSISVGAKGAKGDTGATGNTGSQGFTGWSPVLAVVSDGERRVVQVYDWTGSTGTKPAIGQYISTTGFTSNIALATDIRGATGTAGSGGTAGTAGNNGWSPVLSLVTDGARRVLQVYDWVGGTGSKPATGSYIGASGLTGVLASAVDVRGSIGATGAAGADAPSSVKVELDVGSTPVADATFTITNALVSPSSVVFAQVLGVSPSDSRPIDEIYAEQVSVFSRPQSGQVVFNLLPKTGTFSGKYVISYRVG